MQKPLPGIKSMDVNEALQFADQLVFKHTDKHLDSIQKAVVEGIWQRDTYEDIAKKYNLRTPT